MATAPQGPLSHLSMPLRGVGVAQFARLGLDPGAPTGSLRVILQVRRAGTRHFSVVRLDPASGLLCVGGDAPTARMRATVPSGTFQLKLFVGEQAVQVSPSRELGVGLGVGGSVNVQVVRGILSLASPFHMSARVDWGRTHNVLASPAVDTQDEFRLVPDFALAYSAGGSAPWDWRVYSTGSELLEFGVAELGSGSTLVTAPARPAQQLRAWLMWTVITAILFIVGTAALGAGWAVSAAPPRGGRREHHDTAATTPGAVAVRRTADGSL